MGGAEQRAASWYFLLFQYQGKAEQLLQADGWKLFREFMGPYVGSEDMAAYIRDLSRPGALSAGAHALLMSWQSVPLSRVTNILVTAMHALWGQPTHVAQGLAAHTCTAKRCTAREPRLSQEYLAREIIPWRFSESTLWRHPRVLWLLHKQCIDDNKHLLRCNVVHS